MKKYSLLLIALLLVIVPIEVLAITTDKKPPVLNSITTNQTNYNAGDKVYLNLDATDDVTGVQSGTMWLSCTTDILNAFLVDIEDIKTKPYITIPTGTKTGSYQISSVTLQDGNGNISYYSDSSQSVYGTAENSIKITLNFIINIVNENVVESTDYGKLTSISFEKKEVKIGSKQTISATIESVDGIKTVKAELCAYDSNGTDKYQSVILKKSSTPNVYTASFDVSTVNGTYEIYNLYITTVNENTSYYGFKADAPDAVATRYSDERHAYYFGSEVTYEVIGGTQDNKAPILNGIKFNKTKSDAPSRVYAILDIDEASRLNTSTIFLCKKEKVANEGNSLIYGDIEYDENEDLYYAIINIDQYVDIGTYHIAYIDLADEYGNRQTYSVDEKYNYGNTFESDYELVITDLINADYTTSTIADNMLNIIKDAKDDDIIMIDGTQSTHIPKSVFEAIQGTNKTIYIEYNGIQWVFNGKDITNPKDIDATFNTESYYDENDEVEGVNLVFAANGELPGKAKVRIKAEYTYDYEFYTDKLYVYYYDEENDTYYLVAEGLGLSEDGYYEFDINHNSTYKLTNKEEKNAKEDEVYKEINNTKKEQTTKTKNKINVLFIIIPSVLLIIIIIVIVIIIIKKKKSKKNKKNKKIDDKIDISENEIKQIMDDKNETNNK